MEHIGNNLSNLMLQKDGRIKSFSYENPKAQKGMAAKASSELGKSRKGAPFVRDFLPGTTEVLADITGPCVIRHFFITVTDLPEGGSLEKLFLRIYWDGEKYPSVECPIGDFFCCEDGKIQELCTLPIVIIPARSFHCYFPMPFRQRAVVTIENGYKTEISVVAYQITCTVDHYLPNEIRYFYANTKGDNEDDMFIIPEDFCLERDKKGMTVQKKCHSIRYWYQKKGE